VTDVSTNRVRKDGPLVSTVIPTFNRQSLIGISIDSALAQTYENQEIIVVDDGSTDNTGAQLLAAYGDRIRYVYQPNGGVSSARNHGMRLARGELIALLDSDDTWEPSKIAKQVAFLERNRDYGMVLTDVLRVNPAGEPIDVFRRRDAIPTDGKVLHHVVMNPALAPASAMFRKHVVDSIGGFDESLRTAEDIDFHLRVAAAFKIGIIEECLTTAVRGGDGLSEESDSDGDYVRVVERFLRENDGQLTAENIRASLFMTYVRNSRSAFLSARYSLGGRFLASAAVRSRSMQDLLAVSRISMTACRVFVARSLRIAGK